jgi:hypothetical protein
VTATFRFLVLALLPLALGLSGCVGARVRALESRELQAQLTSIHSTTTVMQEKPSLGRDFAARVFVSGTALNKVLQGLSNTHFDLKSPKGASIIIDDVKFELSDGSLEIVAKARAVSKGGLLEADVRVRADLEINVQTDGTTSQLAITPMIREIVPTVRVSIFKFRLWWFVERLLFVKAGEYVAGLPAMHANLDQSFDIELVAQERHDVIKTDDGGVYITYHTPGLSRHFAYRLLRVINLKEGMYFLFTLGDGT